MTNGMETQTQFDKPLDLVHGNQDYLDLVNELELLEIVIGKGLLESHFMKYFEDLARKRSSKDLAAKRILKARQEGLFILKSMILRKHLRLPLRPYAIALAATPLYQKFCGINRFFEAEIPSKTTINRLENSISSELLKKVNTLVGKDIIFDKEVCESLGFDDPFQLEDLYADTTCIKANIHYPVDWVLFRDLIRTSMLKVSMIRDGGIKSRMLEDPSDYLSDINSLCIEMHGNYYIEGAAKKRKSTFRKMKKLLKCAMGHVERHLNDFKLKWLDYDFSTVKAQEIISCLEKTLRFHKEVVSIAHKRIISEKILKQEDKILSIYEGEVHIIKRNKHSVKSEFGNTLQIIEQQDGFIIDYDLLEKYSPGDQKLGITGLKNIKTNYGLDTVKSFTGDRGYDSKEARDNIKKENEKEGVDIECDITPKDISDLLEKFKNDRFKNNQKRRANTEAKIAHIKGIAQNPMRQKGIRNRKIHMGISVLTHNLFKFAKLLRIHLETISEAA